MKIEVYKNNAQLLDGLAFARHEYGVLMVCQIPLHALPLPNNASMPPTLVLFLAFLVVYIIIPSTSFNPLDK